MANYVSTGKNINNNDNSMGGNAMKNFINNIIRAIANVFNTLFHKEKEPTYQQLLNQEYSMLSEENEKLVQIEGALKGWPGWNDPYTFDKVCELVKQVERTPDRYNGSEGLHDNAGGNFYYWDKDNNFHEVPYLRMSDEYFRLTKLGVIPKDWNSYKPAPAHYDYLQAMVHVISRLKSIKWHVEFRKKKNQERMDAILNELYPSTETA